LPFPITDCEKKKIPIQKKRKQKNQEYQGRKVVNKSEKISLAQKPLYCGGGGGGQVGGGGWVLSLANEKSRSKKEKEESLKR